MTCDVEKIAKELSDKYGMRYEEALTVVQTQARFESSKSNEVINSSLVTLELPVIESNKNKEPVSIAPGSSENIDDRIIIGTKSKSIENHNNGIALFGTRVGVIDKNKIKGLNKTNNFGNPFMTDETAFKYNTKGYGSPDEVSSMYVEWLKGNIHQDIQPSKRKFINNYINKWKKEGRLGDIKFTYWKKSTSDTHIKALLRYMNELNENSTATSGSVKIQGEYYNREDVKSNPNNIYLFGDNTSDRVTTKHVPTSTQAVIRGLPNALGIDTKRNRKTTDKSYFTDGNEKIYVDYLIKVYNQILKYQSEGKTIVLPKDGIGTGKAMMQEKSPKLYNRLASMLNKIAKDDNYMSISGSDTVNNTTKDNSNKSNDIEPTIQGSDLDHDGLYNEDDGDVIDIDAEEFQLVPGSVAAIFDKYLNQDQDSSTGQTLGFRNQEFLDSLSGIVNIMDEALNSGANNKISITEITASLNEATKGTTGYIEHGTDGSSHLKIRWNGATGTARKSEIFLHEMVHFMTRKAFALRPDLQIIIKELQKNVRDAGLDYNVFLQDIIAQGLEPTEFDIQVAKDKWEYTIGTSADPEEFFAYMATNESLYMAVKDLKVNPKIIEETNIDDNAKGLGVAMSKVINSLIRVINKIWSSIAGANNKDAGRIITDTMNELVTLQAKLDADERYHQELAVDGKSEDDGIVKDLDDKLRPWVEKFDNKVEDLHKAVKQKKPAGNIIDSLKKISLINRAIESNVAQFIVTTITKKTNDKRWAHLYKLYRVGKNFTEKHRKGLSDAIGHVVDPYFENVDESTRKAISRVLFNIDAPSLMSDGVDFETIRSFMTDNSALEDLIEQSYSDIEKSYKVSFPGMSKSSLKEKIDSDIKQARALALSMNDGNIHIENQQLNANNIVKGFYESGKVIGEKEVELPETVGSDYSKAISDLNMYITYYALRNAPQADRVLVKKYLGDKSNVKNIEKMLNMYDKFVTDATSDLTISSYDPIPKGYFESYNKAKMKYELIPEDEVDYYSGKFGNLENIGEYGTINGVKYYKMVGRGHDVGFDEGMISIAGTAIPGISLKSLLTNQVSQENRKKSKSERESTGSLDDTVQGMLNKFIESGGTDSTVVNSLESNAIPVYDFIGNIIDYKIQASKYDKVKHMNYDIDVVESAKYTFSKLQHRQASVMHNKEVVDELLEYSNKNVIDDPDKFIVIGKKEDGNKFSEDQNGRWDRIPDYTRSYIFAKTGKHELVIPKDMMELITGEKQVTLSNFNVGPVDLRNNPKTQRFVLAMESYIKEIAGWMKETIAIRMGGVIAANTVSNAIQAWVHGGVDPIEYLKRGRKSWQELNDYRELLAEADNERVKLAGEGDNPTRQTQQRLKILENRLAKNRFHKLVEDGQFSPIIEDVNITDTDSLGHLSRMIEKGFNTNNFTKSVKPIKEFIFMDRNTKVYQSMMKMVQYGDVITKDILLQEKIDKAKRSGRPMTNENINDYLNFLDQLFVNYGYVDNRFLSFAEKVMYTFFTKYFFRQPKAIQSVIAQNPGRYGIQIGSEYLSGIDFETAEDAYYSPITSMMNKFGFLHPGDVVDDLIQVPILNAMPKFSDIVS